LQKIVLKLLETSGSKDEETATRGLASIQIFAALVEHWCYQRRKVLTPIELLHSIEVIPEKAIEIIRIAGEWLPSRRALPKTWPKPNIEHTRARIEALASENRLSSATAALGTLQDLLVGVPAVPVPSPEFIAQRIKELHPESDERDVLPDSMDDPSFAECLQLNTDQVRDHFYFLKKNTGAGNTGWTFSCLIAKTPITIPRLLLPQYSIRLSLPFSTRSSSEGPLAREGNCLLLQAWSWSASQIEAFVPSPLWCSCFGVARAVIGPKLRPQQLRGGLNCGVKFGARLLNAAHEREDGIISVDIANAFNTTRHRLIYDGLHQHYLGILRYYRMKYETAARIVDNQGKT
jgi:hypothetical protein